MKEKDNKIKVKSILAEYLRKIFFLRRRQHEILKEYRREIENQKIHDLRTNNGLDERI